MADRNAPEPAGMPEPLPWAKELDVYAVKDDVKPVLRHAINKEGKLRRRDQNNMVHPPQQISVYKLLRNSGRLVLVVVRKRLNPALLVGSGSARAQGPGLGTGLI